MPREYIKGAFASIKDFREVLKMHLTRDQCTMQLLVKVGIFVA